MDLGLRYKGRIVIGCEVESQWLLQSVREVHKMAALLLCHGFTFEMTSKDLKMRGAHLEMRSQLAAHRVTKKKLLGSIGS